MEGLLNLLPLLFSYLSGILVIWGISICCKNMSLLKTLKERTGHRRSIDLLTPTVIFSITAFILLSLFIFPQYLPYYIEAMFIAEIWYTVFLGIWTVQIVEAKKQVLTLQPLPSKAKFSQLEY